MPSLGDLVVRIGADISGFRDAAQAVSAGLDSVSSSVEKAGLVFDAAFTAPLAGIGVALFEFGEAFDKAKDTIIGATGAMGDDLKSLKGSFKSVFEGVPQSASEVAGALSQLASALGLSGPPLESLTTQVLNLSRVTGQELGPIVTETAKLFQFWQVSTDQQSTSLDLLLHVAQTANIHIAELESIMVRFGPALEASGFGFSQSATLIGALSKAGLEAEPVLTAFQRALLKLGKEGVADPVAGLQQLIDKIKGASSEGQAFGIGANAFGRGATVIVEAIRSGRLDLDAFTASMAKNTATVNEQAAATLSFGEKLSQLKNKLETALEPIGTVLVESLEKLLTAGQPVLDWLKSLGESFEHLDPRIQTVILGTGAFLALLGPALGALGAVVIGVNVLLPAVGLLSSALGLSGLAGGFASLTTVIPSAIAALGVFVGTTLPNAVLQVGLLSELMLRQAVTSFVTFATTAVPAAITALLEFTTTAIPSAIAGVSTLATTTIPSLIASLSTFATVTVPAATSSLIALATNGVGAAAAGLSSLATNALPFVIATLSTLGVVALAAGAAFLGFELGKWADKNIPVVHRLAESFVELIEKIPLVQSLFDKLTGVTAARTSTEETAAFVTHELEKRTAALGIVIDKTGLSTDEYQKKMLAALEAAKEHTEQTDKQTTSVKHLGEGFVDVKKALEEAKSNFEEFKSLFEAGAVSQDQFAAALERLRTAAIAAGQDFSKVVGAAKELDEAQRLLATGEKALYTPAILDQGRAFELVTEAQNALRVSQDELTAAKVRFAAAVTSRDTHAEAAALVELTTAEIAEKNAIIDLSQKHETLRLSENTTRQVTDLLAAANKEYIDLIRAATGQVILPYADALAAEQKAKQEALASTDAIAFAELNLLAAKTRAGATEQSLKPYIDAVNAARAEAKVKADALKDSETDLNATKTASQKIDKILIDGQAALGAAYSKFTPVLKSLGGEMADISTKETALIKAQKEERDALDDLTELRRTEGEESQAVTDAIGREELARKRLTAAETALSAAEQRLQKDWGVSVQAIQKIMDPLRNLTPAAQTAEAALVSLGITPQAWLQELADKARTAYEAIATSGTASIEEVRRAHIQALQDQIAAQVAAGREIPAAQQIELATLEQQEQDYINNSVKRWGELKKTLHDDISGMFTDLSKALIEGSGNFGDIALNTLKKLGEDILNAILKPAEDAISAIVSKVLVNVATHISDWLGSILGGIFSTAGSAGAAAALTGSATALTGAAGALSAAAGALTGAGAAGAAGEAAGAAGSIGSSISAGVSAGVSGLVSAVSGVVTAISSVVANFQLARLEGTMNAVEQHTKVMAITMAGIAAPWEKVPEGQTTMSGQLWLIIDELRFGYISKNVLAIKDAILSGVGATTASSGGDYLKPMLDQLALIQNNTFWAVAKLDAIWQLMQNGIPISTTTSAGETKAPSPTAPRTTAPALPSAPGGSRTDSDQRQATAQQQQIQAQQDAVKKTLSTLQDAYTKALSQYKSDLGSISSTQDEIVAIKQKIAAAMEDLNNAQTEEQQAYYREILNNLQGKLVDTESLLANTQQSIEVDLAAQEDLKQQIATTQAKLAELIAGTAAPEPAPAPVPLPSAPGGSRTDTEQHPVATGGGILSDPVWTDMAGQFWGAIGSAIPDGWFKNQFGDWSKTPLPTGAQTVPFNATQSSQQIVVNLHVDSSLVASKIIQGWEDFGYVVPQS